MLAYFVSSLYIQETKFKRKMRTRIQKWGNSLALRIPKSLAAEAHIKQESLVEVSLVDGRIVVFPVESVWTLEHLLAGITEQNLHCEVEVGPATGTEAW